MSGRVLKLIPFACLQLSQVLWFRGFFKDSFAALQDLCLKLSPLKGSSIFSVSLFSVFCHLVILVI